MHCAVLCGVAYNLPTLSKRTRTHVPSRSDAQTMAISVVPETCNLTVRVRASNAESGNYSFTVVRRSLSAPSHHMPLGSAVLTDIPAVGDRRVVTFGPVGDEASFYGSVRTIDVTIDVVQPYEFIPRMGVFASESAVNATLGSTLHACQCRPLDGQTVDSLGATCALHRPTDVQPWCYVGSGCPGATSEYVGNAYRCVALLACCRLLACSLACVVLNKLLWPGVFDL
jgi:hypothetical protein